VFIPLTNDDITAHSVVFKPFTQYASGSAGSTGAVALRGRTSPIIKSRIAGSTGSYTDTTVDTLLKQAAGAVSNRVGGFMRMRQYMSEIERLPVDASQNRKIEIVRFRPGFNFDKTHVAKRIARNLLQKNHAVHKQHHWGVSNYDCINFYATGTDEQPVLMYPNIPDTTLPSDLVGGVYTVMSGFNFDFSIKVTEPLDGDTEYKAGTLFHMSSSYAVSIVSGSARDARGAPAAFRLLLQLSGSADVSPSSVGPTPTGYTWLSDDNSLKVNKWHHCQIKWQRTENDSTGSFIIDGETKGSYPVPIQSVAYQHIVGRGDGDILFVGNYYEGVNSNLTGPNLMSLWFATNPSRRNGTYTLINTTDFDNPSKYFFKHPLRAEVHEMKIFRDADSTQLAFDVPVLYTSTAPTRSYVGLEGGILITPFQTDNGADTGPFAAELSFGVGGLSINSENWLYDFANESFPRLQEMSASISSSPLTLSANDHLYTRQENRRRNNLILPCDDGTSTRDYSLYTRYVSERNADNIGIQSIDWINLNDVIPTASINPAYKSSDTRFQLAVNPSTPEDARSNSTRLPTILQRTGDNSSNEIVIFDISTAYYGESILPGSLEITDLVPTGTSGLSNAITLRDDGFGGLYRHNTVSQPAINNTVGSVFYNEGLVIVRHPALALFGKDSYEIKFKGHRTNHTIKVDAIIRSLAANSSSNPSWTNSVDDVGSPDAQQGHVWISGMQLHDENLNVIAKIAYAQPILKRMGDQYLLRAKIDI
jgi:hypothetical protein